MEAGPAPEARPLMNKQTFLDNFSNLDYPRKTYLCYEVELLVGENSIPLDEYKGFLHNKGADMGLERCHAEPIFLERMASWNLDTELRYRITVFISWSPCPDCADELVKFLRENRHVNLRIFAARIYDYLQGYEAGLRALKAAGTDVAMMTFQAFCFSGHISRRLGCGGLEKQPPLGTQDLSNNPRLCLCVTLTVPSPFSSCATLLSLGYSKHVPASGPLHLLLLLRKLLS
ncbi:DNA dC-_dU-editing enzyme APOBEC-3A-like [Pteropus vampyrus]|uniref:DNA dC->dU-editing enzyme APOBEC-3G n=1 Tax=Pteropus vampyrus TaxID=132908 RepID=A0A6P3PSE5_PTEVA|nr:DNA dC->dU-editing enzyme APOBEC-3A-like [Pteropus vampyrus]